MKKVYAMWLALIFIIFGIYQARSQELTFGEEVVVQSFFCIEEQQLAAILGAHQNIGLVAGGMIARHFMSQGVCAVATLPVRPIRIVRTYPNLETANGPQTFHHVEVQIGDDTIAHMVSILPVKDRSARNPT